MYIGATSGGVERVFLSRSEALLRRYPNLEIEVYFYEDWGGVTLFKRFIKARNLSDRLRVTLDFDPSRYDAIFPVDTPRVLADHPSIEDKVFMECHTPYVASRAYLQEWQTRLKALIVPSRAFLQVIEAECPSLQGKIKVVRNFVPRPPEIDRTVRLPAWRSPLFLYFGRIDEHKNLGEFVEALSYARSVLGREPLGIICGQIDPAYPLREVIRKHNAGGFTVVLPPVPFENGHVLLKWMRQKRAVYVSCSKGESFGLSVAEAITAGMPVILSDISPHSALVAGRAKFLYPIGNIGELTTRMFAAAEQYDEYAAECVDLARDFSEESFLTDWEGLFAADAAVIL